MPLLCTETMKLQSSLQCPHWYVCTTASARVGLNSEYYGTCISHMQLHHSEGEGRIIAVFISRRMYHWQHGMSSNKKRDCELIHKQCKPYSASHSMILLRSYTHLTIHNSGSLEKQDYNHAHAQARYRKKQQKNECFEVTKQPSTCDS